jgi:hypothetical protein
MVAGPAAGKREPSGDYEGTEQLQRPHATIPVRHLHGLLRQHCAGFAHALARLNRGLLVYAADRLAFFCQRRGVLIQVQHRSGFGHKGGVRRLLPAMLPPGFDLVLAQPAPEGCGTDGLHHPFFHGDLGQFFP